MVPLFSTLLRLLGLLFGFADLSLQLGLQLVGALVLGHFPQHQLQAPQLILRRLRAAWLDGEVKSEEDEKEMLANLIR